MSAKPVSSSGQISQIKNIIEPGSIKFLEKKAVFNNVDT
jgi:hypothetical protein